MKRLFMIAAVCVALSPLAANAQERMSDTAYLSANRCLAYADLPALQSDPVNFTSLREAVNTGTGDFDIRARAREFERSLRVRARVTGADELRERREEACSGFVESGLVQLNTSAAS